MTMDEKTIMKMLVEKKVMTPTASVNLAGVEVLALVRGHRCGKSMMQPGGTCEVVLAEQTGALAEVGEQLAAALSGQEKKTLVPFEFYLGYRSIGQYQVFTGHVRGSELGPQKRVLRIEANDDEPLRRLVLTEQKLKTSPQEVVEKYLQEAGLPGFSVDLPTYKMEHSISDNQPLLDLLGSVKRNAKIPFSWFFDVEGYLHWRPWAEENQGETYVYRYQENIVSLSPIESNRADEEEEWERERKAKLDPNFPPGPVYRLEAIPQPWIFPWAAVQVEHPRAEGFTHFRVDSIEHRGGHGRTRTVMHIRGIS